MVKLSCIDLEILRALADNGRLSWRDLAQKVDLSLTPTLRRVHRLEGEHYIQGCFARFDEECLFGAIGVFISVSLERQTGDYLTHFEGHIIDTPQIVGCPQVAGDTNYMLRVVVEDLAACQASLTNTLTCIPDVAGVRSALILKPVTLRSAPPL